ncbi:MAG TPA: MopE-related protein [Flavobacteriaceae bacterium]|nr:MopE-related protein [Flavobacteriaceae bacterium]
MKKITYLLFLSFFITQWTHSQCISNNQHNSYSAVNNGFLETMSTTFSPGSYMTIDNILENEYLFFASHTDLGNEVADYIFLTDSSNNLLDAGVSPLNYTFSPGELADGTIRLHIYLNEFCDVDDINLTVVLLNSTVEPSTCQLPQNPTVSYRSDVRIDFNWEAPDLGGIPESYDWEAVPSGNPQGVGVVDSGTTVAPNASANGLSAGTSYVFYIRSNCGANGSSEWFSTPPLQTNAGPPPTNDFCEDAALVIQDTGVTVGTATSINSSLLNTAGTSIDAEQCSGTSVDNARDDVWYTFFAQTTDVTVTLEPMFNGILTLFSACNSSAILACSDANGSALPRTEEITYNGLTIGQTYYVRVYYQGFATATPTFSLKIWSPTPTVDNDGDGYGSTVDCNDEDPDTNPGVSETCDGLDNNCNTLVDEGFDEDEDGFTTCQGDCDDNDDSTYPGAPEIPADGIDQDCDGEIDNTLGLDTVEANAVTYFPNPIDKNLTLKTSRLISEVKIYNILGQCVLDKSYEMTNQLILNLETLPKGTYFVKLNASGASKVLTIFKR